MSILLDLVKFRLAGPAPLALVITDTGEALQHTRSASVLLAEGQERPPAASDLSSGLAWHSMLQIFFLQQGLIDKVGQLCCKWLPQNFLLYRYAHI